MCTGSLAKLMPSQGMAGKNAASVAAARMEETIELMDVA